MSEADPLTPFKEWEGEELGENREEQPGFKGLFRAPSPHLHIAGAWAMSTARRDGEGDLHPAVYVRQIAGAVGTGPRYHVLDGLIDADVAEDLGQTLIGAAQAARRDIEAEKGDSDAT